MSKKSPVINVSINCINYENCKNQSIKDVNIDLMQQKEMKKQKFKINQSILDFIKEIKNDTNANVNISIGCINKNK